MDEESNQVISETIELGSVSKDVPIGMYASFFSRIVTGCHT